MSFIFFYNFILNISNIQKYKYLYAIYLQNNTQFIKNIYLKLQIILQKILA